MANAYYLYGTPSLLGITYRLVISLVPVPTDANSLFSLWGTLNLGNSSAKIESCNPVGWGNDECASSISLRDCIEVVEEEIRLGAPFLEWIYGNLWKPSKPSLLSKHSESTLSHLPYWDTILLEWFPRVCVLRAHSRDTYSLRIKCHDGVCSPP